MNRIISKKYISEDLIKFEISTSKPVKDIKPGQYIIFKLEQSEEGYPLPVIKVDVEKETITLIVSVTDCCNRPLADLNAGSSNFEIDGPFGDPIEIENYGTVLCIGRGPGIVPLLPVLKVLHEAGNQVISILSAETNEGIILQNEINAASYEVIIHTDDGSKGEKGNICQVVEKVLKNNRINHVFVIGSAKAIKETCLLTTKYNIKTQAILHKGKPIKNGVHGIFRVTICGNVKSICVDGYNFNAWYPNFDEMLSRFGEMDLKIPARVSVLNEINVPG